MIIIKIYILLPFNNNFMTLENTLSLCSENYLEFKKLAEESLDINEKLKYYKKALFWLENYIAVYSILIAEKNAKKDEDLEKIEKAKKALINKLSKYLDELINNL
ncbi:MAG: hypothetical protein QW367_02530 [Candidatus Aenigmatarchaeota archaeon]